MCASRAVADALHGVAARAPRSAASTTSSDIRSSSLRQTALSQATVTTPSRSETGSETLRERAGGVGPGALDGGEQGRRLERVGQRVEREADRPRAAASRRVSARGSEPLGDASSDASLRRVVALTPSAVIAIRATSASSAAGHVRELGRRDHGLAVAAQQRRRAARGGWRRARSSRRRAAAAARRRARRASSSRSASSSASRPEALLAARAVGAQLAALAAEGEVVAVRAVAGEAALEVGVDALGELGGQRLGVVGLRARPVAQLDLALQPEALRRARRSAGAAARRSRRDRPSARRRGGPARRPRPAARRARRGRRGSRPAARCAGRARPRTRGACRRGPATARRRPGPGARGAAPARPSTSSSRSGRKTDTSGRASAPVRLLDRRRRRRAAASARPA